MTEATRDRIYYNYQYAGLTVAAFFLVLIPLLWRFWPLTLLCVFLQLPAYFGHQAEEYFHDNFRLGLNHTLAHGNDALTKGAALFINIAGVWGTDLVALYLCAFFRPGLGLIAVYLALVNGAVHVLVTLVSRAYNPGVITALFLLIPFGTFGLIVFARTHQATTSDHLWSLGAALFIHIMIALHVYRRVALLKPRNVHS